MGNVINATEDCIFPQWFSPALDPVPWWWHLADESGMELRNFGNTRRKIHNLSILLLVHITYISRFTDTSFRWGL